MDRREHPFPEVDPEGIHYPIVNAERGPLGWAPLAKHPLYPLPLGGTCIIRGCGCFS